MPARAGDGRGEVLVVFKVDPFRGDAGQPLLQQGAVFGVEGVELGGLRGPVEDLSDEVDVEDVLVLVPAGDDECGDAEGGEFALCLLPRAVAGEDDELGSQRRQLFVVRLGLALARGLRHVEVFPVAGVVRTRGSLVEADDRVEGADGADELDVERVERDHPTDRNSDLHRAVGVVDDGDLTPGLRAGTVRGRCTGRTRATADQCADQRRYQHHHRQAPSPGGTPGRPGCRTVTVDRPRPEMRCHDCLQWSGQGMPRRHPGARWCTGVSAWNQMSSIFSRPVTWQIRPGDLS